MRRQIGCTLVVIFVFIMAMLLVLTNTPEGRKQRPEFPTFHR